MPPPEIRKGAELPFVRAIEGTSRRDRQGPTIKPGKLRRKASYIQAKNPPANCRRVLKRYESNFLLGHLAADFPTFVGGSVDVDVPFARHQVSRLLVGERC